MGGAEAVPQAADLGDDQVDEGVDQLVEDLQMFVLFEAAETLSEDTKSKWSGSAHTVPPAVQPGGGELREGLTSVSRS